MPDVINYSVEMPAGGVIHLQSAEEVDLWNSSLRRYRQEYIFQKINDLVTLGSLLQQQINAFRAQTAINGMAPEMTADGVPTGRYRRQPLEPAELIGAQRTLTDSGKEMRALEKSLGIDKAARESGGSHTIDSYLTELKRAANARGIHISKRTLAYEAFKNDLGWRMRMLYLADPEDRAYHDITPKTVLDWVRGELLKLDEVDREFAKDKGMLYAGKL